MPGLWCNERRRFLPEPELMGPNASWYEDEEGFLYILPPVDMGHEGYGPDNDIMDELWRFVHEHKGHPCTEEETQSLGLTRVNYILWRWSPEDGFYHA